MAEEVKMGIEALETQLNRDVPDIHFGNIMKEQPEIILCKDCRYSEYDSIFHSRYCHNKGKAEMVGDDFFCAAGEVSN